LHLASLPRKISEFE